MLQLRAADMEWVHWWLQVTLLHLRVQAALRRAEVDVDQAGLGVMGVVHLLQHLHEQGILWCRRGEGWGCLNRLARLTPCRMEGGE